MKFIEENCELPTKKQNSMNQSKDLVIIGGATKSKEFRVHKNVLAAQSRVLALSFSVNDDILKITDFSAPKPSNTYYGSCTLES
jgi:hypothetical protein